MEDEDIKLRAIEPYDIDLLYQWENNSQNWENGILKQPISRYTIENFILNSSNDINIDKQLKLIILLKNISGNIPIGSIDIYNFEPLHQRAGIGIIIPEEKYRRKNYALKSLNIITNYAFNILLLKQLYSEIAKNNTASYKLFLKAGFTQTAIIKNWYRTNNNWTDQILMQIFNPLT